jgi:hypothetical protein
MIAVAILNENMKLFKFKLVTWTSNELTVKMLIQIEADKYFPVSKYQGLI